MNFLETLSIVIFYLGITGQGNVNPWFTLAPLLANMLLIWVKDAMKRHREREALRMILDAGDAGRGLFPQDDQKRGGHGHTKFETRAH